MRWPHGSRFVRQPERLIPALLLALFANVAGAALQREAGPRPQLHQDFNWMALRRYSTQQGLLQNSVRALAQDRSGFLFVATEDGVARFDGQTWLRVELPEQAGARPFGSQLIADADGGLWIGTDVAGLWYRSDDGNLQHLGGLGEQASIEALIERASGSVYAGTPSGVFACNRAGCAPIAATAGLEVAALLRGTGPNGDALWIGTNLDGLYRLDQPESAHPLLADWHLDKGDGLPNSAIRSLAVWNGDLWIGTGRGVAHLVGEKVLAYDASTGFGEGVVAPLLPGTDDDGRPVLLAGLARTGMAQFQTDGSVRLITTAEGLPENSVLSLLETGTDSAHRLLWIGTNSSGLLRREPQRWTALDERHGLPHRVVYGVGRALFPDGIDTAWVGTIEGPARWVDGGWRRFLPEPLARRVVYSITHTPGHLWLATDQGLLDWSATSWHEYTSDNSNLPGVSVLDTLVEPVGDKFHIWIATRHGLARLVDGNIERLEVPELGGQMLARVLLRAPAPDGQSRIWLASSEGLAWYDGQGWHAVDRTCLPNPDVMDLRLQRDADGMSALWLATRAGITRIGLGSSLQCASLDTQQRPPGQVYNITFDKLGRLYAFGSGGVTRYEFSNTPTLVVRKQDQFGIADGLPGLEFNRASYTDAKGRIWAGGVDGLALFDPAREIGPGTAAPLRLLDAHTEREPLLHDGAQLEPGDTGVAVDIALLSYERPEQIRYRADLQGPISPPAEWVASGRFQYNRLPPGDYQLRLRARDAYNVEAEPIHLAFSIRAPWWRTHWALAGWALLLLFAGLGLGRLRSESLRRRALALERDVAIRTRELAEANRRLHHASLTDPLTGLWNRRHFALDVRPNCEDRVRHAQSGRETVGYALLLIDVDHFKRINDVHGHSIGDAVLVEIAQRLRGLLRDGDELLRWGGEEFLLLVPDDAHCAIEPLAQRVLAAVAQCVFEAPGSPLAVTCSIGCCRYPFNPQRPDGHSLDQCLRLADAALYRAKRGGRNRASWVQPSGAAETLDWLDICIVSPGSTGR